VPLEGVVDALRTIHAALVPQGLLVDTQPLSAQPAVTVSGSEVGRLDMVEWAGLIASIDQRVEQTVTDGLWSHETEQRFMVTDSFESGQKLVETVSDWGGTRVPSELAQRLAGAGPARLHQDVRLRVLRAL
jgi:hypothetical protein